MIRYYVIPLLQTNFGEVATRRKERSVREGNPSAAAALAHVPPVFYGLEVPWPVLITVPVFVGAIHHWSRSAGYNKEGE